MNNFEKLKVLDPDSFAEKIQDIFDTPFKEYIDWKAYMRGESEKVTDYFFSKETCRVLPCEAEIKARENEARVEGKEFKQAERNAYIAQNTRTMIVLHKSSDNRIFGNQMVTVADLKNNQVVKIPVEYVKFDQN